MYTRGAHSPQASHSKTSLGLVLIVEYNRWLRLVFARLFTDLGYSVATASNGYAGLRLARELQPRVAILGDSLPELSTEAIAEELRTLHQPKPILVVRLSELLDPAAPECCAEQRSRHAQPQSELELFTLGSCSVHAPERHVEVVYEDCQAHWSKTRPKEDRSRAPGTSFDQLQLK